MKSIIWTALAALLGYTCARDAIGPYGDQWFDSFSDPSNQISQDDSLAQVVCRSNTKLDFLRVAYKDTKGVFTKQDFRWGEEKAGHDEVVWNVPSAITKITPYICHGKHKGLVCGIFFEVKEGANFLCGVPGSVPTVGVPKAGWDLGGRTIHSLMFGMRNNPKTIVSVGWTLKDQVSK